MYIWTSIDSLKKSDVVHITKFKAEKKKKKKTIKKLN